MYIFVLKNIDSFTLTRSLISLPGIFIGAILSKIVLKVMSQKTFNTTVVIIGLIAGIKLLI